MLVLGMDIKDIYHLPFQGLLKLTKRFLRTAIPKFHLFLIITILHRCILVNTNDGLCWSIRKCKQMVLCYHTYFVSKGILTFFPFSLTQLVSAIRTNLLLADFHCQETLALSVMWILTTLRSYYRQDSHYYSIHIPSKKCFYSSSTPIYQKLLSFLQYR